MLFPGSEFPIILSNLDIENKAKQIKQRINANKRRGSNPEYNPIKPPIDTPDIDKRKPKCKNPSLSNPNKTVYEERSKHLIELYSNQESAYDDDDSSNKERKWYWDL